MRSATEPVGISPRVDCVFKAILGDPRRSGVLLDFLQAVLEPTVPLVDVTVLNPIHPPDFVGDDFTVVDVLATDATGQIFQIEMQTRSERALHARILYTWSGLYDGQLRSGDNYALLRPVISIWLLDRNLLTGSPHFHHRFAVHDAERGVALTNHLEIHTLELQKWRARPADAPRALAGWMSFFAEAERWAALPEALRSEPLEEAMDVLNEFKDNNHWSLLYRSRKDAMHVKATLELEVDELKAEKETLAAEKETLAAENETLAVEKETLAAEKETLAAEKETLAAEKETLAAEKETLAAEKETLAAENETLAAEKETLAAERDAMAAELEALRARLRGP